MLRFGTNNRGTVRNYSTRREQLRLLALFVPLALVMLLVARLRDPKTAAAIDALVIHSEESIKPRPAVAASSPRRSPGPFPGIRNDLLKSIEDNTYFRTAEKNVWFHFIELIQKEPTTAKDGVEAEYAQLVDQPNVYRGKLVRVRGTARQITQEKPADNSLGLSSYYRVVIQPADGANWPIIVYCLDLPNDVSPKDELALDVTATGLFFKNLSYQWRDGLGIAPVILAKNLAIGTGANAAAVDKPATNDTRFSSDDSGQSAGEMQVTVRGESSPKPREPFHRIMTLAGWGNEQLARFEEGESLTDPQRVEALEMLHRLRLIRTSDLDAWSSNAGLTMDLKDSAAIRGQLCRLNGRITKVTQRKPSAADAERLDLPVYFECEFEAAELAGPATIITGRVPADWLRADGEYDNAAANVLFVKRLTDETPPRTLWLAKEIAWYPRLAGVAPHGAIDPILGNTSDPRFGKSLLGVMKVDVGKFDQVSSRGRIRAQESDLFYETLHAAQQISPSAAVRIANGNLPFVRKQWEQILRDGETSRQQALAREVARRADEGRYSVALLFNDPLPQRGRLFVFDGVVRRAVRVEVDGTANANSADDTAWRLGIDHYYELEIFTDDSQNYPLIYCVRELPKGFPIGADIRLPARVAGFFFKNWLYSARGRSQSSETADANSSGPQAQFAPLLIGTEPIVLESAQPVGHAGRFVLGGLFVLAMLGVWGAAAWFARDDRRFRERTSAANYSLPPGQSLNDLNLDTGDVPMTIEVASPPTGELAG